MPAANVETLDRFARATLRSTRTLESSDERRKCDRAVSLWHRRRDAEALPCWSEAFMADARELSDYCIVGSTDAQTAAVAVEEIGPHLRSHLTACCPDRGQIASRAAILLKEVVDAARWLHDGSAPRPVAQVYGDTRCPEQTVKSRFVILPFADKRPNRLRWLAVGDWCAIGN